MEWRRWCRLTDRKRDSPAPLFICSPGCSESLNASLIFPHGPQRLALSHKAPVPPPCASAPHRCFFIIIQKTRTYWPVLRPVCRCRPTAGSRYIMWRSAARRANYAPCGHHAHCSRYTYKYKRSSSTACSRGSLLNITTNI